MRSSLLTVAKYATILGFSSTTFAETLTIFDACPSLTAAPSNTVTSQYQPVSTCYSSSSTCVSSGNCTTSYAYSTWDYVSTVIPCAYDGTSFSNCTVTRVDDSVVLRTESTTVTSINPVRSSNGPGRWRQGRPTVYTTIYEVRDRETKAKYDHMGPMAIPGYPGSGLCESCGNSDDDVLQQEVEITECRKPLNADNVAPECRKSTKVWHSLPEKMRVYPTTAVFATQYRAPSAGVYTFSFSQTAPAKTITVAPTTVTVYYHGRPTQSVRPVRTVTVDGQTWYHEVTKTCQGPTTIDVTTTLTTTITYGTSSPIWSSTV